MSRDVYVFAEQRDGELQKVGIELVGKARELADDLVTKNAPAQSRGEKCLNFRSRA